MQIWFIVKRKDLIKLNNDKGVNKIFIFLTYIYTIMNYRLLALVIFLSIIIERVNSWCLKTQLADSGQINYIDWSRDGTKFVIAT